jgi:RimJ/RimL family protein N-acetyltransferase
MELRDRDLLLRPWRLEDAPALTAALQDPEIPRWIPMIPFGYSADDARQFLERSLERAAKGDGYEFAILEAETGGLLGSIGMNLAARMGVGHVGYWIAREARGRGIATRALRRVCAYGFEELGLGRLELMTDPENRASQRVAEKVGFRREGVLRSRLCYQDGRRADGIMFSLLPGELR